MATIGLSDDERYDLLARLWPRMTRDDFDTYNGLYDKYFLFIDEQMSLVRRKPDHYSAAALEEFMSLIGDIRASKHMTKADIAASTSERSLRSMDIAVQMWLTIRVQNSANDYESDNSTTPFLWARDRRLATTLEEWFIQRRDTTEIQHRQIPSSFSVPNLVYHYNFKVTWTSDLLQHLTINWKSKQIIIFEHGICLRNHLEYDEASHPCPLPREVIEEAVDTIRLLFPASKETKRFLMREGRSFLKVPYGRDRRLYLGDYGYWRQSVTDLLDHWEDGPKGWAQIRLNPDQGNLMEYATFWAATTVLILTIVSIVFGIASLVIAKQALDISIKSYNLALAEACAEANATDTLPGFCA
ncbi:hypothetical protein FDECE_4081 [Fusarium decemcellulare]|nr:hypothetical protein FDECE_4081 [Fusarium decemcellulare]